MKLLVVRHTDETPPGSVLPWASSRQHEVICVSAEDLSRAHSDVDGIILCGGEMGTYEETKFPWLKKEKDFLAAVLAAKTPIVGLCLGGQLLAEVLGGKVEKYKDWEIGWQSLQKKDDPENILAFSDTFYAFQYHQDIFTLPPQARSLVGNDWWPHQAFSHPAGALGFQFHPEADQNWIRECALDPHLPQTGRSQSSAEILAATETHLDATRNDFFSTLDRFFERQLRGTKK